ncbi:MAG: peptide ABC transporter substrate-binding protein, partial [Oscillospiraceae bacterium]|nr:peptide ABC transporter substrate-binding protein [Oscillospiraceae bacterium]
MQKRIVALLVALACVLSLTSCGKREYNGQILRYNVLADAKNLDPQLASDNSSALVLSNIMEGLMTIDEQGDFALGLAEIVSIDDTQKKYTFTLRESARWSDDTKITADDFVFAFRRLFDPQTKSQTASKFFCIKNSQKIYNGQLDVTQLGVYNQGGKLVFELERVTPEFLAMLTLPQAMPCKESFFYETKGRYGTDAKYLLYSGPYYLKAWYKGEQIAIRKNALYHDKDNVYSEGVNFFPVDSQTQIKDFINKKSDVVIVEHENYTKGIKKSINQSMSTWGILCNLNDSFFGNNNVRKALSMSFDNKTYEKH